LRSYPGPWLAAATDWYNVYHCLTGDRHIDFLRLHEKYGPAVRFGPNRVSFCVDRALQDIYGVRANTQKSQVYSAFSHFFAVPASLTTIDRKAHSFKRRVTSRALSTGAVNGLQDLILKNVRVFCASLKNNQPGEKTTDEWSAPKDMSKSIQYLLSDIMGDVTFSKNWDIQASTTNRYILDLMSLGTCGINLAGHIPTVLKLNLDKIFFPTLTKGVQDFFRLSETQSSWRLAQDSASLPNRDLFAALLDARDPDTGKGYSERDLIAEAGILIIAGADTTATATTATLFYLLHSPEVYERVRAEVDAAFPRADGVDSIRIGSALASCVYLYACIEEAMRLCPPVGAMLPREVLPGGLVIDGGKYHIPAGTDVGVPTYALHHTEKYWPEAHSFRPERWLNQKGAEEKTEDISTGNNNSGTTAYAPFGAGRTSCVGKYLAYQEMGIIIARLFWLYDMRVSPGTHAGEGGKWWQGNFWEPSWGRDREGEFQIRDVFTSSHDGPQVQFRSR
jgi:cytochrome P450